MHISHARTDPARQPRNRGERGASLVEYALLVALIAIVCIGSVTMLGGNTSGTLDKGAKGIEPVEVTPPAGCPSPSRPNAHATGPGYPFPCYDPDAGLGFNP